VLRGEGEAFLKTDILGGYCSDKCKLEEMRE